MNHLKETNASGGGDEPEAVMDGLKDAIVKSSWRFCKTANTSN